MITGTQLRMARAALKIGVRELAKSAGVSPATITRIENGHPANVSTLIRLESVLGMKGVNADINNDGSITVRVLNNSLSEIENTIIQTELKNQREHEERKQEAREWIVNRDKEWRNKEGQKC
ncbi:MULTISPECIES: helix-turn-helix domain-containing protein [Acetobacter]|nr:MULTISPECIES: helix-turn-helix domain-containing protein [Acetobacter]